MKIKSIAVIALTTGVAFCSCSDGSKGKDISEMKGLSTSDSLSYYLGESLAGQYMQMSASDTVKSVQAKRDFIKGFLKGMELMESDSEAYRNGLMVGFQSAAMSKTMKDRYGVSLNHAILETGYNFALRSDSTLNVSAAQSSINHIAQRLEAQVAAKENAEIGKALNEANKKMGGFTPIGEDVLFKSVKPGQGNIFKNGDNVNFSMSVKDMNGKNIPDLSNRGIDVVLGQSMPSDSFYAKAMYRMKPGETAELLIPAGAIFRGRAAQYGYKNSDILVMTLTVKNSAQAPVSADRGKKAE